MPALLLTSSRALAGDVDTQFIFGFTQGADTGELGEKELEWQTIGRFGKAEGSYTALLNEIRAEFSPIKDFRFEGGTFAYYHSIAGVDGLDDRNALQFGGLVGEARYRVLNRRSAPFGLAIGIEPHWSRVDDLSGQPVGNWGGELSLALDGEPIEDRLFAALNVVYDPEWTHFDQGDTWQKQSTLGLSGAAVWQFAEGLFIGAETHWLLQYNGTGLDAYLGQGLYVGPTFYWRLAPNFAISGSWSIQVAGDAIDLAGPLNLRDFEQHQARLRLEYNF